MQKLIIRILSAIFATLAFAVFALRFSPNIFMAIGIFSTSLTLPLVWLLFRRTLNFKSYLAATVGFCGFVLAALMIFFLIAGAITVGIGYFRPIALLTGIAPAACLIFSYLAEKKDRVLPGVISALLAVILAGVYVKFF